MPPIFSLLNALAELIFVFFFFLLGRVRSEGTVPILQIVMSARDKLREVDILDLALDTFILLAFHYSLFILLHHLRWFD